MPATGKYRLLLRKTQAILRIPPQRPPAIFVPEPDGQAGEYHQAAKEHRRKPDVKLRNPHLGDGKRCRPKTDE